MRERFIVAAPVGGRLLRLPWHEGDRLTAGTIVARIDALPSTSAVSEALAQLRELRYQQAGVETLRPKPQAIDQARWHVASALAAERAARDRVISGTQAYDQAVRDTRRAMALAARGYLPAAQLEAAQLAEKTRAQELRIARNDATAATAEVRTARAALAETEAKRSDPDYLLRVYGARMAAIEAQLATLEDQRSRTTLYAPVSGTVLRVLQKSEQFVPAGTAVLELADRGALEIAADVLSQDAARMRPGNSIVVVRGAADHHPRGRVRLVEPAGYTKVSALGIEEQRVNVIGDFLDPPTNLGDQYRLDVQIVTWRSSDAVKVPLAALFPLR